jgi:dihydropteroate synthase
LPFVHNLMIWQTARFAIDLRRPQVMGIVNVTPDSFSDGGQHADTRSAIGHCDRLVAEGADILDIGGESTRPGAATPSAQDELARVLPVLRHAVTLGVPVSVDTSRPEVIRAALGVGVDVVNDVRALGKPGALAAVAGHARAGVCLMHLRGEPATMQQHAVYDDVVREVLAELAARVEQAEAAGISRDRIAVDPGIGFAKKPEHNLELLARQRELLSLGQPLLLGWSRKSTLGVVTGRAVNDRATVSVAAALLAIERGAHIVRVHDVAPTVDALKLWLAARPKMAATNDKTHSRSNPPP